MNTLLIICLILLFPFIPITFVFWIDDFTLSDIKNYKDKIKIYLCITNSIRIDLSFLLRIKSKNKKNKFPLIEKIISYVEVENLLVIMESNNVYSSTILCIILNYLRLYVNTHFLKVENDKYEEHYYNTRKFISCSINIKMHIRTINVLLAYINNELTLRQKKGKKLYVKSQNQ